MGAARAKFVGRQLHDASWAIFKGPAFRKTWNGRRYVDPPSELLTELNGAARADVIDAIDARLAKFKPGQPNGPKWRQK